MSFDVDGIKGRNDIVSVVGSYVALKKRGAEFVGLCPFHKDHDPSFWVSPVKQFGHCFSCGANHDVISFVQEIEGIDFKAACEKLGGENSWTPKAPIEHEGAPPPRAPRITSKPPADAPPPKFKLRELGEPVAIFEIRDLDGSLIAYECRYEVEGKKEPRIWSWGAREGETPKWRMGHLNEPRPLYGLERVGERPDAPVLITEGPKKADAGARLLPNYASVSWTGGANAWHKHDWKPLAGKKVLIFPDNDEPGLIAAEKLAALLGDPRGLGCKVRLVDPAGMATSWDIADWRSTTDELIAWAKPRAHDYVPPLPEEPAAEERIEPAPPAVPVSLAEHRKKKQRPSPVDGNVVRAPHPDDEPMPAAMSEDFIADHFATLHAERWRYVRQWGMWFEWRGDGWYSDDTAKIDRLAVEITRQALYWPEAAALSPSDKKRVNSKRTAGAVRDLAMSDRRIAARVDQWDTDPWLLGVPGGVVDLKSGEHGEADPESYMTKRTAIAPAAGEAPLWRKFLSTVMDGNEDMIAFLQRYAGYCLTGETSEQALAFLYGTGQNGKGVFISTIAKILGDYACAADADVFMETDYQRHPTEMARLRGARLVHVDETDSSKRWNEKRIKRITGGGRIEARFMNKDHFEFQPQFKLLIAGNHKPQLRGVGKAIQRRIHLVPFTVTIRDEDRDNDLPAKLEAEYPQILAWMVQGCLAWQREGLAPPAEVVDATQRYIEAEDVIGEWLEERTEQNGECERPNAYKNYRAWCESRGERAWSSKSFTSAMEEKGHVAVKIRGAFRYRGLSLRLSSHGDDTRVPDYPF